MPNWTSNSITIKHSDKAKIDLIVDRPEDQGVLQTLIPCPAELNDDDLTTWSHGEEQAKRELKQAEMVKKYGYKSWYDWNIAHWGTKWDLCDPEIERLDDNTIVISCQTAWSPPTEAFEAMLGMGYEVRALYVGEGNEYAGIWDNGDDEYYQHFDSSEQARATLPQELDDFFGISDSIAEYEEESRREEELYRFTVDGAEKRKELGMVDDLDD